MKIPGSKALAFLLVALASLGGFFVWIRVSSESPPDILLITLDTTRADRIGAYGYQKARTPVLDQLAREGVLFERAISPAPLTLPVHACLLTGLYPPEHGLRTNGYGKLPEQLPTMAEILSDEGYEAGAFVASFVLDHKFGLNRGFEVYDDNLADAKPTQDAIHRFRDGRLVVDAALKWLGLPRSQPVFCWVHLYDPHAPYEAHTAEFGDDFADSLYDGEIAYTDLQVGRLIEYLKEHPRTIVIVAGDHGESLGDHFELQHGYTLYDSTQHVPFIIKGFPDSVPGTRISSTVSLVDLLPTVTDLVGQPQPNGISGRSLKAGLLGQSTLESRVCYGGTDDPFLQNAWSPLRSLTTDGWRYIRTTRPELYDLVADPQELKNLASEMPERVQEMDQQLIDLESAFAVTEAADVQLSGAEQKALSSLGYIGGASREEAPKENTLPDVKDMLPFNVATQQAIDLTEQGQFAEAEILLKKIVSESPPEHVFSRLYLGSALGSQGKYAEAEEIYKKVLDKRPDDETTLFQLGTLHADQGQFEQAVTVFERCLDLDPESTEPLFNLGLVRSRMGDADSAERIFRAVLQLDPMFPGAWVALGTLLAQNGRTAEAISAFNAELEINPESIEANINLGVLLGGENRIQESHERLLRAVELAPERTDARFNLGICEEMLGNFDASIAQLKEALRLQPETDSLQLALANVFVRNKQPADATREYEAIISRSPENVDVLFRLATLHSSQGGPEKAIPLLEQVLRLQPEHAQAKTELQRIRNPK